MSKVWHDALFFRMSAFDSPLAKPQTSVTNMSANAGAELSIFWQSVLSSNPQTNQGGLKLKLKKDNEVFNRFKFQWKLLLESTHV